MQRSERYQLFERRGHARIDAHRPRVIGPAVHDPMPNADETVIRQLRAQKRTQVIERSIVAEARALGPGLLRHRLPVATLRDEAGCGVDPFDLAAHGQIELIVPRGEERELDAGRASI